MSLTNNTRKRVIKVGQTYYSDDIAYATRQRLNDYLNVMADMEAQRISDAIDNMTREEYINRYYYKAHAEASRKGRTMNGAFHEINDRAFSAMESNEAYIKFLEDYNQDTKKAPPFEDVCSIMIDEGCIVINVKEK